MACSASTSDQIINTRRAFGVWYLFYYALYLAVLGLAYLPKQEELKTKFKRFHHDMAYYHYFFVICTLVGHTNTAHPAACAFTYIYVAVFALTFVGYFKEIHILVIISTGVQLAWLFAIWMTIMVSDWWDFYTGRYIM